jgi:hypothetical protein
MKFSCLGAFFMVESMPKGLDPVWLSFSSFYLRFALSSIFYSEQGRARNMLNLRRRLI